MYQHRVHTVLLTVFLAGCASSKAPSAPVEDQGMGSPDLLDVGNGFTPDRDTTPGETAPDLPDTGTASGEDLGDAALDRGGDSAPDLANDISVDLPADLGPADLGDPCAGVTCSDSLACTTDTCKAGKCVYTLKSGWCKINGLCYLDGAKDPSSNCLLCKTSTSTTAWSAGPDGVACASDSLSCTADACKAGKCNHQLLPGYCIISGTCYKQGAANPQKACSGCYPGVSNNAWSTATNGTACTADNFACTNDTCSAGVCTHPLKGGWCKIGSACYAAGASHPTLECTSCNPGTSTSSWTASQDGTTCKSDGLVCTNDTCTGGKCSHTLQGSYCYIGGVCYTANTTQPGHLCGRCNPGLSQYSWSNAPNGAPCTPDAHGCTNDICQNGGCTHPVTANFCFIGGQCYSHATAAPGGGCNFCNANKNQSNWTPITFSGCCAGQNLYYCLSGSLNYLDCSLNPSCGWSSFDGYYDCGTAGGSGPTPKNCF